MTTGFYGEDHALFRSAAREFVERDVRGNVERWESEHEIGPEPWLSAGRQGLLGMEMPEAYGGGGQRDFRYRCVLMEEMAAANATSLQLGFAINDDIVGHYLNDLATPEQKKRWLPRMCAGQLITAIAMTEPAAGSDLQGIRTTAARDGDDWVVNGAKTFITNGINAGLVIVAARTDPGAGSRGISLLVVEEGMPGFSRGRKLEKIGIHGQDTAELFFDNVRVPAGHLLGEQGGGFRYLMERLPRERMSLAWYALCSAEAVFGWTLGYARERTAFGQRIGDFQNTKFSLAEMRTGLDVTRAYLQQSVLGLNAGALTAVEAAKAKWWATETQKAVTDQCVQIHGGYGYMLEYPVARAFLDSRVQTIYGGTTEIMKEIIGRDLMA